MFRRRYQRREPAAGYGRRVHDAPVRLERSKLIYERFVDDGHVSARGNGHRSDLEIAAAAYGGRGLQYPVYVIPYGIVHVRERNGGGAFIRVFPEIVRDAHAAERARTAVHDAYDVSYLLVFPVLTAYRRFRRADDVHYLSYGNVRRRPHSVVRQRCLISELCQGFFSFCFI